MSYQPLWLRDLVAYSIQAAALVGVGVIMARALQLRLPRVRHAYWEALLAICVFLPLLQPWRPEVLETSSAAFTNITLTAASMPMPAGPSLAEIVLWLDCAGIVLRFLWMVMGFGRLWLYRRNAQRMEQTPEVVEEAQRLAPASASFFISRQLPTPATFGFFHPSILFPARFLEMEPAMQKAVALHELLHVERRDWLWNMFEEIVLTLLWFHLPLWWVVRSARLSREQVVDAEAVRRSNARRPYLRALLEMAGQKQLAESLPAPLFLRESQLAERIALMMKEVHMSRTRLTVSILTAAVTLLMAGATMVWAFPLKTSALQAETPTVASAPVPAEAATSAPAPPETAMTANSSGRKKMKIYEVGGEVKAPSPIYYPKPPYTEQARKAHLSGVVVLRVVISADGRVLSVKEMSKRLGQGLDENAIKTINTWKFNPAVRDGVAVPVKVKLEVGFKSLGEAGKTVFKPSSANDPPAQGNQSPSADVDKNHKTSLNPAEIQRQIDEAMKQAQIAQEAASKIDQKKLQEQIDQAMKQLKLAEAQAPKIDQEKINQQIEQAMKQIQMSRDLAPKIDQKKINQQIEQAMKQAKIAQKNIAKIDQAKVQQQIEEALKKAQIAQEAAPKVDQAKIQQQVDEAMKQLQNIDTPEMRRQYEEALKQMKTAQMTAPKIDQAKLRQQVEQAMQQAKIAQAEAAKVNQGEVQRQLRQAQEELKATRKQLEKAREQLKNQQMEMQRHRKEAVPLPPAPPTPASPSPGKVESPAPPASPQPPVGPSSDKIASPPNPSPAPSVPSVPQPHN